MSEILPYIPGEIRVWVWTGETVTMHHVPAEAVRIVNGYDNPEDARTWLEDHGHACDRVTFYEYGKPYPEGTGP